MNAARPVRRALFLFAALALTLAACQGASGAPAPTATYSPQATTAAGLTTEGDERLALSDFAGAERAYQQAITADPDFAPAHSHLAFAQLFNPETRRAALEEAQKATMLAPDSAEAWAYLARAYDWNGQFDDALSAGEKAVNLDANNADAQSFLGEVYADLRRYDEAQKAAELAVRLDPNNAEAHRNLGYLWNAMSRYEDALTEWQAAYDLQPKFVHRLTALASYYLYLRPNSIEARRWLADALALAPDDPTALIFLSRLDAGTGDLVAAQQGCDHILQVAPSAPDGHNCAANVYAEAGDWEAAKAARSDAIQADPNDETGYTGLGYVYFATNDCRQAITQFQKAIDLHPRSGQNYSALALAQLCSGEADGSIKSYEKAIDLEPYNGDHHIGLGRVYLQQNKFSQAEAEMQKAIAIDPKSDQFVEWLGRVYAAQGDMDKAIEQYQQAAELNPADGADRTTLGFARLQHGDFAEAAAEFEKALQTFDEQGASPLALADARYGLGLTYVAQNDCANAVPALQEALRLNPNLAEAQQYLFACRRSTGLTNAPLPAALTASGPLGAEGAVLVLNQALPGLGVRGEARYEQVSGVTVLALLYEATAPPNDPAYTAEQSPLVYAGAWALARLNAPVENLLVVAIAPDGTALGTVHVRREYALWWTEGIIDDDAFATMWNVTTGG